MIKPNVAQRLALQAGEPLPDTLPSGKPLFYVDNHGARLCPSCANEDQARFGHNLDIIGYVQADRTSRCAECGKRV